MRRRVASVRHATSGIPRGIVWARIVLFLTTVAINAVVVLAAGATGRAPNSPASASYGKGADWHHE